MGRCSERAYAMCPDRHLCGTRNDAVFTEDSLCAVYNGQVELVQLTNADRIREMSDLDLARFLAEIENRRACGGGGAKWKGAAHALDWLRQPAKEDT